MGLLRRDQNLVNLLARTDTRDFGFYWPVANQNLGNIDNYVFGYRYYPVMNSRAGFAWHNEYSWIRGKGLAPDGSDLTNNSVMAGFDFDF